MTNSYRDAVRRIDLRPISEIVDWVRQGALKEAQEMYDNALTRGEEKVRKIETNRQAFALLDAAGYNLELSQWHSGSYYHLKLGHFKNTKKDGKKLSEEVRKLRLVLGCRLENAGKTASMDVDGAVEFRLKPKDFPGLTIEFTRPLKKGAKCKLVRQRGGSYTTLVCETP